MRFVDDAWLAGFTDGEGSFLIATMRSHGTANVVPQFKIGLRADEFLLLEALAAEFGGRVYVRHQQGRPCPYASWHVAAKADLARLVTYFDQFPLRAKKARDYALWRRAVAVYLSRGGKDAELWILRDALIAGRKFEAVEDEPRTDPRLRLVS